jgi:hypothetical protein
MALGEPSLSSVQTLVVLHTLFGLFFMGAVKTAHTKFPAAFLKQWYAAGAAVNRPIGSWKVLRSEFVHNDVRYPMFALGWQDLKLKAIISNRGTTVRGEDSVRHRHRKAVVGGEERTERLEKCIPRPTMIEQYFRYFSTIDVHDHLFAKRLVENGGDVERKLKRGGIASSALCWA